MEGVNLGTCTDSDYDSGRDQESNYHLITAVATTAAVATTVTATVAATSSTAVVIMTVFCVRIITTTVIITSPIVVGSHSRTRDGLEYGQGLATVGVFS